MRQQVRQQPADHHQAGADEQRPAHPDAIDPSAADQRQDGRHQGVEREQRTDAEGPGAGVDRSQRQAHAHAAEADVRQNRQRSELEDLQDGRPGALPAGPT